MNPATIDIKDLLEAESDLGLMFQTNLFVNEMPDKPDACVCVYAGPGRPPEPQHDYKKPAVQVRIRGAKGDPDTAHRLGESILRSLHQTTNHSAGGARYLGIWARTDVNFVGFDDNHRPLFTVNFDTERTTT